MRTITTTVYNFDELSDKAKEYACDYVREMWHDFYAWHNENAESLKGFAKFLGGKCDWSVSLYRPSSAQVTDLPWYFTYTEDDEGYDVLTWMQDNKETILKCCPFTGFHMDEYLLDPMREYLDTPDDRTMEQLIQEGCDNWVNQYVLDWENCYTDEYITDFLQANEYEFTEGGAIA